MDELKRRNDLLLDALVKIRDSTFRNAASLRAIADAAINSDRANDWIKEEMK